MVVSAVFTDFVEGRGWAGMVFLSNTLRAPRSPSLHFAGWTFLTPEGSLTERIPGPRPLLLGLLFLGIVSA